jgi:hypothetical protein
MGMRKTALIDSGEDWGGEALAASGGGTGGLEELVLIGIVSIAKAQIL